MAYTTPATWVAGAVLTAAQLNTQLRDNVSFLANPPACRVYHNAAQTLVNNTPLTVAFNSERYDTNTMHDTSTNNSRITFNTAGLYVVTFNCVMDADNDLNWAYSQIVKNAALTPIAQATLGAMTDAGLSPSLHVSTIYKFAAADYIQVTVAQKNTSANSKNLGSLADYSPEFAATWIGLG